MRDFVQSHANSRGMSGQNGGTATGEGQLLGHWLVGLSIGLDVVKECGAGEEHKKIPALGCHQNVCPASTVIYGAGGGPGTGQQKWQRQGQQRPGDLRLGERGGGGTVDRTILSFLLLADKKLAKEAPNPLLWGCADAIHCQLPSIPTPKTISPHKPTISLLRAANRQLVQQFPNHPSVTTVVVPLIHCQWLFPSPPSPLQMPQANSIGFGRSAKMF